MAISDHVELINGPVDRVRSSIYRKFSSRHVRPLSSKGMRPADSDSRSSSPTDSSAEEQDSPRSTSKSSSSTSSWYETTPRYNITEQFPLFDLDEHREVSYYNATTRTSPSGSISTFLPPSRPRTACKQMSDEQISRWLESPEDAEQHRERKSAANPSKREEHVDFDKYLQLSFLEDADFQKWKLWDVND